MKKVFFFCEGIRFNLSSLNLKAQVEIQVNSRTIQRKIISPYIYGLNPYHYDGTLTGMSLHDNGINVT